MQIYSSKRLGEILIVQTLVADPHNTSPGARFSKLPVITGPVSRWEFQNVLTIVQLSYQLNKQNELY